jgi:hypothetical protein
MSRDSTNPTVIAFGTYEDYRREMIHYEDNPYDAAVRNTTQGVAVGDAVLAEWSARLARELLQEGHESTKKGTKE